MKNAAHITALFALLALAAGSAAATETVSPGALDRLVQVNNACPTFSWGEVDGALAYELVAYRMPEGDARELGSEDEALFASVTGSATSWTPSADQCFAPGERYVWFVRSVTEMIDDQVIEVGEWSAGRYFEVPAGPTPDELARALDVLKRWEAAGGSPTLFAGSAAGSVAVPVAASGTYTGTGSDHRKSVQTATAAIRGENPETDLEAYGVVGSSASVWGAGVAAVNTEGGADLVLDGSIDGMPDTRISEWGIDRSDPTDQTFIVTNNGGGGITLDVLGTLRGTDLACPSCVDSTDIADGAVGATQVEFESIGEAQLADEAVTNAKLAVGAVDAVQLSANSVDSSKIIDGSVIMADLADESVGPDQIEFGGVGADNISAGAVGNGHLATDAVTSEKIANGTITDRDLADESVTGVKIENGVVGTSHLENNSVTTGKILNGTILGVDLADGAVDSAQIADGAVQSSDIAGGGISTIHLADAAVTSAKIASAAVGGSKIVDGSIGSQHLGVSSVTSAAVLDGSITAADLADHEGLYVNAPAGDGLYVANAPDDGIEIESAADTGMTIRNSAGTGLFVEGADGHGVHGETDSAASYGGYFVSAAYGGDGLYAESGGGFGIDLVLGSSGTNDGGTISSDPSQTNSDIDIRSFSNVMIQLDQGEDHSDSWFRIRAGDNSVIFEVSEGGTKSSGGNSAVLVDIGEADPALVYAVHSPQNWIEDFGSAFLGEGEAWVALDDAYSRVVSFDGPYHVFLTPLGDCPLYVAEKSASGFIVRSLGEGRCDVGFDYRVVALRSGYETQRMERYVEREDD